MEEFPSKELQLMLSADKKRYLLKRLLSERVLDKEEKEVLSSLLSFFCKAVRCRELTRELTLSLRKDVREGIEAFLMLQEIQKYLEEKEGGDIFSQGLERFLLRHIANLVYLTEPENQGELVEYDVNLIKELLVFLTAVREVASAKRVKSPETLSILGL